MANKSFVFDRFDVLYSCMGGVDVNADSEGEYVNAEAAINREAVNAAKIATLEAQLKDLRSVLYQSPDAKTPSLGRIVVNSMKIWDFVAPGFDDSLPKAISPVHAATVTLDHDGIIQIKLEKGGDMVPGDKLYRLDSVPEKMQFPQYDASETVKSIRSIAWHGVPDPTIKLINNACDLIDYQSVQLFAERKNIIAISEEHSHMERALIKEGYKLNWPKLPEKISNDFCVIKKFGTIKFDSKGNLVLDGFNFFSEKDPIDSEARNTLALNTIIELLQIAGRTGKWVDRSEGA